MAIGMPKKAEAIEDWIVAATGGLAKDPAVRVREETRKHYDSAVEDSKAQGASTEDAERAALSSLGDARAANRQYRKIHLTSFEKKLIREDEWVARKLCAQPYLWMAPVLLLCAAIAAFAVWPRRETLTLLAGAAGVCLIFGVPFVIPINTRLKGNIYRAIRWMWLVAIMWLPYNPGDWALALSTGLPILWMVAWLEWSRATARRKLPVAEWPRSLYL